MYVISYVTAITSVILIIVCAEFCNAGKFQMELNFALVKKWEIKFYE